MPEAYHKLFNQLCYLQALFHLGRSEREDHFLARLFNSRQQVLLNPME